MIKSHRFEWFPIFLVMSLLFIFGETGGEVENLFESPNLRLNKCLYNELGRLKSITIPNTAMANNSATTFPLQLKCATRLPHCMQPCATEILRITIPLRELDPEEETNIAQFTPSGFLQFGTDFYPPDEYCIFSKNRGGIHLEICRSDCSSSHVCVPKCCSADKVLDWSSYSCEYSQKAIWEPIVHKTEDLQVCGEKRANIRFHYYRASPKCQTQSFFLKPVSGDLERFRVRFRLLLDGTIVVKELLDKEWTRPERGRYCLDGVQNFGSYLGPYSGDPLDQILLVCADEEEPFFFGKNATHHGQLQNKLTLTGILYSVLLFAGTPFLLTTALVYLLLWGKQNVHGRTLFCHTVAIFLNYLGHGITNTVSRLYDSVDNASTSCILIGIATHYFALASFSWMTMINYDLWSMFRHLKNTVGRSKGMKRFGVYMALGWGIPFLFVLISVILDFQFGLYADDGGECATEVIVPLYGHKSCYIVEESRPIYLFYPIGFLIGINIILAFLTVYNMYAHNQSAKIVQKKSTNHKRKFAVWIKLFVVMGMALSSEVIVWNLKVKEETLPWYLIFPDVISLTQAIAIFILFACQSKILKQLRDAYPFLKPFLDQVFLLPCYKEKSIPVARI